MLKGNLKVAYWAAPGRRGPGVTRLTQVTGMHAVFKALADSSRRQLLDSLSRRGGQSLRELCADLAMTRQAVSKHLAVLEDAGLVATVRHGRQKLHYLNPVPIHEIYERWISKYERGRLQALSNLKAALEDGPRPTAGPPARHGWASVVRAGDDGYGETDGPV
jgi:DNA-binding transcriptional ArsR family regulator